MQEMTVKDCDCSKAMLVMDAPILLWRKTVQGNVSPIRYSAGASDILV